MRVVLVVLAVLGLVVLSHEIQWFFWGDTRMNWWYWLGGEKVSTSWVARAWLTWKGRHDE